MKAYLETIDQLTLEAIVSAVIVAVYVCLWWNKKPRPLDSVEKKELSIGALNNAIGGGLVAVSILLPISLAVTIELAGKTPIPVDVIWHLKVAAFYFAGSLGLAIWNLFRLPQMVQLDIDLAYNRPTVFFQGLQLLSMAMGIFRLLRAFWGL